jgi:LysR family cyn operon transcriptional activator
MIELRHLRYFLEVARHEHVSRAADALHVTQSTLSHQITQLEALLGTQLFDRIGRGIQLTDAGRTFSDYARRALEVDEGQLHSTACATWCAGASGSARSTPTTPRCFPP